MRFLVLLVCLSALSVQAQEPSTKFDKLEALYSAGDYIKTEYRAYNLTQNEKFRREPLPYLYVAKCNFQFHLRPELLKNRDTNLNPWKETKKYIVKFCKKDKNATYKTQAQHQLFLKHVTKYMVEELIVLMEQEEHKKALRLLNQLAVVAPDNRAIPLLNAVSLYHENRSREASEVLATAFDGLVEVSSMEDLKEDEHALLTLGFRKYAAYLVSKEENVNDTLKLGQKLLVDDAQFMELSRQINEI